MSKEYIADKETLDEVNQKVGVNTDAASGTSLFAKVNSLLNTIANHAAAWTSTRAAKLDSIDTNAAKLSNTTYGLEALKSYVDEVESLLKNSTYGLSALKATVGSSVVKSVQRGVINIPKEAASAAATISAVNTNQSIVLYSGSIDGSSFMSTGVPGCWDAKLELISGTQVKAARSSKSIENNIVSVPYQVIEFA